MARKEQKKFEEREEIYPGSIIDLVLAIRKITDRPGGNKILASFKVDCCVSLWILVGYEATSRIVGGVLLTPQYILPVTSVYNI